MSAQRAQLVDLQTHRDAAADFAALKAAIKERMLDDDDLSFTAYKVADVLLLHLNRETGTAWPSVATIAARINRDTDSGRRMVRRALKELVTRGHWRAIETGGGSGRGQGRTTRYAPLATVPQHANSSTLTRTQESANPDSPVRLTRTQESPEPTREPENNNPSRVHARNPAPVTANGGRGEDPTQANQGEPGPTDPDSLAAFVARRFKIRHTDAQWYTDQWREHLGEEATNQHVRAVALETRDREVLFERMESQLAKRRHEQRQAERTASAERSLPTPAATSEQQLTPASRIFREFNGGRPRQTDIMAWHAWLNAAQEQVDEDQLRRWHEQLAADSNITNWLPELGQMLADHTRGSPGTEHPPATEC